MSAESKVLSLYAMTFWTKKGTIFDSGYSELRAESKFSMAAVQANENCPWYEAEKGA